MLLKWHEINVTMQKKPKKTNKNIPKAPNSFFNANYLYEIQAASFIF